MGAVVAAAAGAGGGAATTVRRPQPAIAHVRIRGMTIANRRRRNFQVIVLHQIYGASGRSSSRYGTDNSILLLTAFAFVIDSSKDIPTESLLSVGFKEIRRLRGCRFC